MRKKINNFEKAHSNLNIWIKENFLLFIPQLCECKYFYQSTMLVFVIFQTRRDSSLVPLRRLSSDKTTRFVYPNIPPAKATQDTPFLPLKSYSKRTDTQMKDNVLW